MAYSHSKINMFRQCRFRYKCHYVDKVEVEVSTTVEAFMGDVVHQVLEKLYRDVQHQKIPSAEELLEHYHELWNRGWADDIKIAKEEYTEENYKAMGEKYIRDYYEHYRPFDQMTTIGVETKDFLTLPDGNRWHVRIDRLSYIKDTYYVCDYKTNSSMKTQEDADSDEQLAMYSIWVKDKFKDAKKVVLLWHMLAFDKEVRSERTDEQLKTLQEDVMKTIKEIETCKEWPTNVTRLCDWCEYKEICPSFRHATTLENKTTEEFKADDGVKLVDEYSELSEQKRIAEKKLEELKEKLVLFSEQQGVDTIYGSNRKVSVKEYERIIMPEGEEKEALIRLLKEKGLYDKLSSINYQMFNSSVLRGEIDPDIAGSIDKEKAHRITLSKRTDV